MRILVLSDSELIMDEPVDIRRASTVEAAREMITASLFDVIVADAHFIKPMRDITKLPVVSMKEATSLKRLRELTGQHVEFAKIQLQIEAARAHAEKGRRALAEVFKMMSQ